MPNTEPQTAPLPDRVTPEDVARLLNAVVRYGEDGYHEYVRPDTGQVAGFGRSAVGRVGD